MKAQDLKCCGNCKRRVHKINDNGMSNECYSWVKTDWVKTDEACPSWAWDKKTWLDRCAKSEKMLEEMRSK